MMDERLKVTDQILSELKRLKEEEHASANQMIWFLFRSGVPKPGALIALRRAKVMPVEETKAAVHAHEAYAYRQLSDEKFEVSLVDNLRQLEGDKRPAAA